MVLALAAYPLELGVMAVHRAMPNGTELGSESCEGEEQK